MRGGLEYRLACIKIRAIQIASCSSSGAIDEVVIPLNGRELAGQPSVTVSCRPPESPRENPRACFPPLSIHVIHWFFFFFVRNERVGGVKMREEGEGVGRGGKGRQRGRGGRGLIEP